MSLHACMPLLVQVWIMCLHLLLVPIGGFGLHSSFNARHERLVTLNKSTEGPVANSRF